MAYVKYAGLKTPNDVISKMAEYIKSRGYMLAQDLTDDLNIYDMSSNDGKKFAFQDRNKEYFIVLRSCNGINIFGETDDSVMDTKEKDEDDAYQGVGMIVSEGYSKSQRWYNQYNIPKTYKGTKALGVFMPVAKGNTYTLWCNNVNQPTDTVVFTLEKEGSYYKQVTHMVFGNVDKYDEWDGGIFFSGSANQDMLKSSQKVFDDNNTSDSAILPILSSGSKSATFLRMDIGEAPSEKRGRILWACSGTANETGKRLSLPIRENRGGNGEIPSYMFMQSKDRLDWGRNINTLNMITIAMPIFMAVNVDPDRLMRIS